MTKLLIMLPSVDDKTGNNAFFSKWQSGKNAIFSRWQNW